MSDEVNCTQFLDPWPFWGREGSENYTWPRVIMTLVLAYRPYHRYVFFSILLFSTVTNFFILIVLAQKEMRMIGVNVTMIFIAICDFFNSVTAICQQYLFNNGDYMYSSYFTAYTRLTVDYLTVGFHASSLYLAAGMAFCRLRSLNLAARNRDLWKTPKYAVRIALCTVILVFLLASVTLMMQYVGENDKGIFIDISVLSFQNNCIFLKYALVHSVVFLKIVPCFLMMGFSIALLSRIDEGKQTTTVRATRQAEQNSQIDRSSRLIQITIVVLVVTELPQAVFGVIGGFNLIDYLNYYQYLIVFSNILATTNTTSSFIIYSTLSSKFRKLFVKIILPTKVTDRIFKKRSVVQLVQPSPHASRSS